MKKNKIILVEDHEILSKNIRKILDSRNFEVIKVLRKGEEVLKELEVSKPNALIMDIFLEGKLDGIQTAALVEKKWNIPVIFLTSTSEKEIINRAKKTGAYSYVTKDEHLKEQLPVIIEFALFKHEAMLDKQKSWEKLSESEAKFKSIINSAKDAIIFIDNDGNISLWNKAAAKMFGYSSKEIKEIKFYDLVAPDDLQILIQESIFNSSGKINQNITSKTFVLDVLGKSNKFKSEMSFSGIRLNGKDCALSIVRDVTERIENENYMKNLIKELRDSRMILEQNAEELTILNEKLLESEATLKEINASKDKFFSIVAHDLRNPFQGLLGYSEILTKDYKYLPIEEIGEIAQSIDQSAQAIYKLFENFLLWSRIQRGKIAVNKSTENMKVLVDSIIDLFKLNAEMKGIRISNHINDSINLTVDVNILSTVLRNLLSNALKFTRFGGFIDIDIELKGRSYLVSVTDNGVGIAPEYAERLFKTDEGFTTKGTSDEIGNGIGLILCKDILYLIGETISVSSEFNVGSTFTFTIKA